MHRNVCVRTTFAVLTVRRRHLHRSAILLATCAALIAANLWVHADVHFLRSSRQARYRYHLSCFYPSISSGNARTSHNSVLSAIVRPIFLLFLPLRFRLGVVIDHATDDAAHNYEAAAPHPHNAGVSPAHKSVSHASRIACEGGTIMRVRGCIPHKVHYLGCCEVGADALNARQQPEHNSRSVQLALHGGGHRHVPVLGPAAPSLNMHPCELQRARGRTQRDRQQLQPGSSCCRQLARQLHVPVARSA